METSQYKCESKKAVERLYKAAHVRFRRVVSTISPILLSKILYRLLIGKRLNLTSPSNFNEKIMWLKFNYYQGDELVRQCVDKYRVREYVEDCGCSDILNDLIGVYQSSDEIDWSVLPNQFVLKCNHGSGYNLFCRDKAILNQEEAEQILNQWLREDYWKNYAEINYRDIEKRIVCEKMLESKQEQELMDYKFYCVYGEPRFLYVRRKKRGSDKTERVFMDLQWHFIDIGNGVEEKDGLPVKPDCFDDMVDYARILSKPFPFVRTDFYEVGNRVVFGELTFTPLAGLDQVHELPYFDHLIDLSGLV